MTSINHDEKFYFYEENVAQIVPRHFFEGNLRFTYKHATDKVSYENAEKVCGDKKVRYKVVLICQQTLFL